MLFTDVGGRGQSEAADNSGRKVGKDAAEGILGHQYIKVPRRLDQLHGGGVDVGIFGLDIRVRRRDLAKYLAEEGHRRQYVGLVYAGDLARTPSALGASFGDPEGKLGNSAAAVTRDHHRLPGDPILFHSTSSTRVQQTFGLLANQDEIDQGRALVGQNSRQVRVATDRAQTGVQVHFNAQVKLGGDFSSVRVTDIGQPDRTKQHRIGMLALGHAFVGKSGSGFLVMCGATLELPEFETNSAQALL